MRNTAQERAVLARTKAARLEAEAHRQGTRRNIAESIAERLASYRVPRRLHATLTRRLFVWESSGETAELVHALRVIFAYHPEWCAVRLHRPRGGAEEWPMPY